MAGRLRSAARRWRSRRPRSSRRPARAVACSCAPEHRRERSSRRPTRSSRAMSSATGSMERGHAQRFRGRRRLRGRGRRPRSTLYASIGHGGREHLRRALSPGSPRSIALVLQRSDDGTLPGRRSAALLSRAEVRRGRSGRRGRHPHAVCVAERRRGRPRGPQPSSGAELGGGARGARAGGGR